MWPFAPSNSNCACGERARAAVGEAGAFPAVRLDSEGSARMLRLGPGEDGMGTAAFWSLAAFAVTASWARLRKPPPCKISQARQEDYRVKFQATNGAPSPPSAAAWVGTCGFCDLGSVGGEGREPGAHRRGGVSRVGAQRLLRGRDREANARGVNPLSVAGVEDQQAAHLERQQRHAAFAHLHRALLEGAPSVPERRPKPVNRELGGPNVVRQPGRQLFARARERQATETF